jgi:hypothetical protein
MEKERHMWSLTLKKLLLLSAPQEVLKSKMERGKIERGLILRNEKANDEYTTDFLTRYLTIHKLQYIRVLASYPTMKLICTKVLTF